MTSMIRKAIPATAALLLLAGSPAFAARFDTHQETLREELTVPNTRHQLPLSSSRSDNSNPYIGDWVEGYPRSAARRCRPAGSLMRADVFPRRAAGAAIAVPAASFDCNVIPAIDRPKIDMSEWRFLRRFPGPSEIKISPFFGPPYQANDLQ